MCAELSTPGPGPKASPREHLLHRAADGVRWALRCKVVKRQRTREPVNLAALAKGAGPWPRSPSHHFVLCCAMVCSPVLSMVAILLALLHPWDVIPCLQTLTSQCPTSATWRTCCKASATHPLIPALSSFALSYSCFSCHQYITAGLLVVEGPLALLPLLCAQRLVWWR